MRVWGERRVEPTRTGGREALSPFERRLLQLKGAGLSRRQIAERVRRSPQTVSNSLTVAKDKIGARSLTEAAVLLAKRRFRTNPSP